MVTSHYINSMLKRQKNTNKSFDYYKCEITHKNVNYIFRFKIHRYEKIFTALDVITSNASNPLIWSDKNILTRYLHTKFDGVLLIRDFINN